MLRDRPKRTENPYVYHLDVGAMYPNIILTNRLQPSAMVDDATCAACEFNQAKNDCKRRMEWIWRGDFNPATKGEYETMKAQLSREVTRDGLAFTQLPEPEQAKLISSRLKSYAKKAYMKTKVTQEETREDIVCMRANDFYVDTVRQFRDRRYEYKRLNKTWKKRAESAKDVASRKQCEDKVLVYDSLQVAHKCILNSFYGYVSSHCDHSYLRNCSILCLFTFWGLINRSCERGPDGVPWRWPASLPRLAPISLHKPASWLSKSVDP